MPTAARHLTLGSLPRCIDRPAVILKRRICLNNLSKNLKGQLSRPEGHADDCREPKCRTLKTRHGLEVAVASNAGCDHEPALDGKLVVEQLVTAFEGHGEGRGVHAGDFVWTSGAARIEGSLSGLTNVGLHRKPADEKSEGSCRDLEHLEGRLCGAVTQAKDKALLGARVVALYRIRYDPNRDGGGQCALVGNLEGVVIRPCK